MNRGGTLSDIGDVTIVEAPTAAMSSPQKFPEQSYPLMINERTLGSTKPAETHTHPPTPVVGAAPTAEDDEWRRRVRTMWRVNTVRVKELRNLNDTLDDALTHTTTSDHCVGGHRVMSGEEGAEVDVSGDRRCWGEEAYGVNY